MNARPYISPSAIVDSIEPAWRDMVAQLFRPFDPARWLALGFTAWLATLGEGGAGGGYRRHVRDPHEALRRIGDAWHEHPALFLGVAAMIVLLILAVSVAFVWLRSRGAFMFLDNVVRRRAVVAEPWHTSRDLGHSLFWWRLAFAAIAGLLLLLTLVPAIALNAFHDVPRGHGALIRLGVILPPVVIWGLGTIYIALFLNDFVVPLMYRHNERATAAWRRFGALWSTSKGALVLYGLFCLALTMAFGAVVIAASLLSCCCLFFLLAVPYLGTVLLLPAAVFYRLFSLEVLRRAGPDFDLWVAAPPGLPPPLHDQPAADASI